VPAHVSNGANAGKLSGSTLLAAQGDPAAAVASAAAGGGLDDIGAQSLLGDAALDGTTLLTATAGGATSPSTGVQSSTLAYTPAAGASHPASQVIAATLQTVAADKPKSFTLALTPAELGRVVVDMKLDADKKMKIVMTVENDSTFHLLQRDQTALQGFLDKAGLAADTEVTFQLASDQQNFDQAAGDRQAFSQDNAPSWRVGAASGADADALQAGLTSDLTDQKGNGRWQINRLV
jgi:flagellar hook-length control protein FliK